MSQRGQVSVSRAWGRGEVGLGMGAMRGQTAGAHGGNVLSIPPGSQRPQTEPSLEERLTWVSTQRDLKGGNPAQPTWGCHGGTSGGGSARHWTRADWTRVGPSCRPVPLLSPGGRGSLQIQKASGKGAPLMGTHAFKPEKY